MLKATQEQEWWADQVVQVMLHGKRALDAAMLDVGLCLVNNRPRLKSETYAPLSPGPEEGIDGLRLRGGRATLRRYAP